MVLPVIEQFDLTLTLLKRLSLMALAILAICPWPSAVRLISGESRRTWPTQAVHWLFWSVLAGAGTYLGVAGDGFIVNFRDVGAFLAGLTGGPVAGLVVGLAAGLHRYGVGGPTAPACALATAVAGLAGGALKRGRPVQTVPPVEMALGMAGVEILHGGIVWILSPRPVAIDFMRTAVAPMALAGVAAVLVCRGAFRIVMEKHNSDQHRSELLSVVEESLTDGLRLLATMADAKDSYTAHHSLRVAKYAAAIGSELGFDRARMATLWLAGLVHDLGKVGVPDAILGKEGPLTEAEWRVLKSHAGTGGHILRSSRGPLRRLAVFAEQHHERYEGGGYPRGLEQRDLMVAVVTLADAIEAMTSHRPHRPALSLTEVLDQVLAGSGTQFHPQAVAAAVRLIETKGAPQQWWEDEEPPLREVLGASLGHPAHGPGGEPGWFSRAGQELAGSRTH